MLTPPPATPDPKGRDSLDAEWTAVQERRKNKKPLPTESIFGSTALPPLPPGAGARKEPVEEEVTPDGLDPRDWSVPVRPSTTGDNRMKVGVPGFCSAAAPCDITAPMHDLRATDQPAAMLTFERIDDAQSAAVRVWRKGKATVKRLWLTHLGSGEEGLLDYVDALSAEPLPEEAEEWEEHLSTEVLSIRVHQAWVPKTIWAMWAPTDSRLEVARRWPKRRDLDRYVEGLFLPRVYGVEPTAVATALARVDIEHREAFLAAAEIENAIPKLIAMPLLPEVVWLGPVGASPENM